jgi:glycosyltransferase involved in cell wall biosynthesis
MTRLRILLTTDAVGGVWTYSLDLAAALARESDAMLSLAVVGPAPSNEQLTRAAAIPGLQLIETGLPLDWTADSADQIRAAAKALARIAEQADADIIQLHTPALACADFPAPVISVVHSCVATWWSAVKSGDLPQDLAWRAALVRHGLDQSDLVITPSKAFAAAVQRTYALGQPPVAVHNGRSPLDYTPQQEAAFAFTAGRMWDEGKNVAAFDAAAALASIPFRAAGPHHGPNGASFRFDHAEALGVLSDEELAATLAGRPIFVSAARYEPFGLSVLEAAQAGCALVLSDIATFRELWDGAAIFAGDPAAIAAAVDLIAEDAEARARLGSAAKLRAERFNPANVGSTMLSHYRALLGSERKAAA